MKLAHRNHAISDPQRPGNRCLCLISDTWRSVGPVIRDRMITGGFFVLLFLFPSGMGRSLLCAQTEETNRFLQEAPVQWEEYTRRTQRLQGRFSERRQFNSGNLKLDVTAGGFLEVKMNERCKIVSRLSERTIGGKKDYETPEVFGMNSNYAFILRRKAPTSPWVLNELTDLATKGIPPELKDAFESFIFQSNVLVTVNDKYLTKIVRDPGFRVLGCRRTEQAGEEWVEIDFDYAHEVEKPDNPNMKGTLLLDPQRFWCVRSYKIEVSQKTIDFQVLELGQTEGSLPVPKRVVRKVDWGSTKDAITNESVTQCEYSLNEPRRLPGDEEFTLSAFGLPDPVGFEAEKPTRWYLWLMLAAIVCLVLGVTARSLRRRARASTNAKVQLQ